MEGRIAENDRAGRAALWYTVGGHDGLEHTPPASQSWQAPLSSREWHGPTTRGSRARMSCEEPGTQRSKATPAHARTSTRIEWSFEAELKRTSKSERMRSSHLRSIMSTNDLTIANRSKR
eukprot:scaffold244763_cov30-Tisochrysis_lutea.AAC.5